MTSRNPVLNLFWLKVWSSLGANSRTGACTIVTLLYYVICCTHCTAQCVMYWSIKCSTCSLCTQNVDYIRLFNGVGQGAVVGPPFNMDIWQSLTNTHFCVSILISVIIKNLVAMIENDSWLKLLCGWSICLVLDTKMMVFWCPITGSEVSICQG